MFSKFFGKKEIKSTSFADLVSGASQNPERPQPIDIYDKISIAFACVEKISCQAESFTFLVKQGDKIINNHPIHKLLFKRDLILGGQSVFSNLIRNILIAGEAYVLRLPYGEKSKNIGRLQPIFKQDVGKNIRNSHVIESYFVNYAGMSIKLPVDIITGYSDLLRMSLFSAKDYQSGASPMQAIGIEAALLDEVFRWNLNSLIKGVKPSGIFASESPIGLTQEQAQETINNIRQLYSGSKNASSGILLPNGIKYTPLQMSSKDMDFINTSLVAAKNVAMAFGVPLPLLFSDASTLDNYKMAIEEFILQTVIPIVNDIIGTFELWYNTITGESVTISIDMDKIDGLEYKREIKSSRMIEFVKAGILTPNEARVKLGYAPYADSSADTLYVSGSYKPIDIIGVE